jgi:hypothetical protein
MSLPVFFQFSAALQGFVSLSWCLSTISGRLIQFSAALQGYRSLVSVSQYYFWSLEHKSLLVFLQFSAALQGYRSLVSVYL